MELLKALAFLLLLHFLFPSAGFGDQPACPQTNYTVKMSGSKSARIASFDTFDPQGVVVLVLEPGKSYKESKAFIHTFCRHGFAVVSFDVDGTRVTERDYLNVSRHVVARLRATKPRLPVLAYGWNRGADVAARMVAANPRGFAKLLLENPKLDTGTALSVARLPRRMTRVFECRDDLRANQKELKFMNRPVVLVARHTENCSHHLSALPEAHGPMLEYIEADFAGVQANNWYFSY